MEKVIVLFLILLLSSCGRGNYNLLNNRMDTIENKISLDEINIESNSKKIESSNGRLAAIEKCMTEQRKKSKTYDNIPPAALIESKSNVQKNGNAVLIDNGSDKAAYDNALEIYKNMNYSKAKDAFSNFLRIFKTSKLYGNAMFWLADAYFHTGDMDKSEQVLKKLVMQYPDKPVTKCGKTDAAMYLLTIIYDKKQDYNNELYYKNMLKSKFPDSVYTKKLKFKVK